MKIFYLFALLFLFLGIFYLVYPLFWKHKNRNFPVSKEKKNPKFCILIPAREESKVIASLLESIQKQTKPIPMEDVYVIVEEQSDPTIKITHSFGGTVLYRQDLSLKRKGYALDEAVKQLKKEYDAYFVFDADNILSPTYLEEMEKTYFMGYDLGIGYRNSKNGNHNVITACSTLTFSMINTIGNNSKNKNHANVVISGTGFYMTKKWVQKWGGYPFHTLTEDYELYLYSILEEMTSYYNTDAIFYDEQPTQFHQTILQRTRWIKGFFEARKLYIPMIKKKKNPKNIGSVVTETVGVKPYICFVFAWILLFVSSFFTSIFWSLGLLLLAYVILLFFTGILIQKEKQLNLNQKMKRKALFFNPLFLASYVICLLKSMVQKEIPWEPIKHEDQLDLQRGE